MTKAEMTAKLTEQGATLTGKETVAELKAMLAPGSGETPQADPEKAAMAAHIAELEGHLKEAKKPVKAEGKSRSDAAEESSFQKTASNMKAILAAQPKVSVYVPLEQGEPKGTQLPVEINGHKMFVPKGVPGVSVPQAVADIIHQSLGIYDEASSALRSENDPNRPLRLDLQSDSDKSRVNA
jgi:hypothetical protein